MAEMVTLTIDGQQVQVPAGTTILEAAKKAGIHIPALCYAKDIDHKVGSCRVCLIEIEGNRNLQASCVYPVAEGMKVKTTSPKVRSARKTVVELLLSDHPYDCLKCYRNGNCELQTLAQELNIREIRYEGAKSQHRLDASHSIVRDPNKCIKCGRCVAVCSKVQSVHALGPVNRGFDTIVAPMFQRELSDTACVLCGQCTLICPVAALREKDDTEKVWDALVDPTKTVVVQVAPAIRATLGEELGMEPGSLVTGKMFAALRRLGFDAVCDTSFAADLTILEESAELLERMEQGKNLPLITSCSPGWVKFVEHQYPELLHHVSSCKSPQQMFGAIAKSYYAEKKGIDPKDMVVVSIMPCTAKKFEAARPEMVNEKLDVRDVDIVLTTRELGRMIREAGIKFKELPNENPDDILGEVTGAGVIFGATGGVMEAALRTAYEKVTGRTLEKVDFIEVRGMKGVKEAQVDLGGTKVKVAVAHGLANARKLLEEIKKGKADYQFIEIMACPGGCIGGGGQPHSTDLSRREARIEAIYREDANKPLRKSHENPSIIALYDDFLGKPLGEKSHHLLHTHYVERGKYPVVGECTAAGGYRRKKTEGSKKIATL